MKVKCPYIAYRKCILRHYDVTFGPIFLKTSIYLLLMTDYHHTKFGLIWSKESKVTEGGQNPPPPPPQVENVLNRPGEIGLINENHKSYISIAVPVMYNLGRSAKRFTLKYRSTSYYLQHETIFCNI